MARTPIHPGEVLADELEARSISAAEAGRVLGVPANRITQILRGRRSVSADTALRLSRWLGTSAEFWMNLQKNYELRLAEKEYGKEIREAVQPLQPSA
jgi:addiction module HigA family antidote